MSLLRPGAELETRRENRPRRVRAFRIAAPIHSAARKRRTRCVPTPSSFGRDLLPAKSPQCSRRASSNPASRLRAARASRIPFLAKTLSRPTAPLVRNRTSPHGSFANASNPQVRVRRVRSRASKRGKSVASSVPRTDPTLCTGRFGEPAREFNTNSSSPRVRVVKTKLLRSARSSANFEPHEWHGRWARNGAFFPRGSCGATLRSRLGSGCPKLSP